MMLLPPDEYRNRQYHQIHAPSNGVVERMEWFTPERAVQERGSSPSYAVYGIWIRADCPLRPEELTEGGWVYFQPCDADAPLVAWMRDYQPASPELTP